MARRKAHRTVSDLDDDELDWVLQQLLRHIEQLTSGDGAHDLRRIVAAARQLKSTGRETLVASKADGNYERLRLPVDNKVAEALVADRIALLDDRRNLIWKSGAVGAAVGAAVTGVFAILLWWLQRGSGGPAILG